uniref:Tyrosine-protein phosphatase domain-containing protein n=1 Tax=Biomphalaria glabrata TaxID=6526 RepID=A0A2C9M725_BIOGL
KRLYNFTLIAFDNLEEVIHYQDKEEQPLTVYTVTENTSYQITQVNISNANKSNPYLTICEVQIFGDCPERKKGLDCNETCDATCEHNCNLESGSCRYICIGFNNPPECNIACNVSKWGINCNNDCPEYCWNKNCSARTGICNSGCIGFSNPPFCITGCLPSTWGLNCSNQCSQHCVNSTCNNINGQCLSGCQDGYKGLNCSEECETGRWGENCSRHCPPGCFNQKCNITSGLCTEGCSNGTWGLYCNKTCNSNCNHASCDNFNGDCTAGCLPGFGGFKCSGELRSSKNDDDTNVGVIIGPVVAAVLLVALIIVAVMLWRRRRNVLKNSKGKTKRRKSSTKNVTSNAVSLYEQMEESPIKEIETIDGGYMNAVPTEDGTSIALKDFNVFMTTHDETFFKQQFQAIPSPGNVSTEYANSDRNKVKNRYKNICTYDHSRVNLKIDTDKGEGDYINASYIRR